MLNRINNKSESGFIFESSYVKFLFCSFSFAPSIALRQQHSTARQGPCNVLIYDSSAQCIEDFPNNFAVALENHETALVSQ